MNNKTKSDKFRKLSIAALVTGILAYPMGMLAFIVETIIFQEILGLTLRIFDSVYAAGPVLAITAIVCGSIDLKRIKAGRYSNNGRGFDIAGIVMGVVYILVAGTIYIFGFSRLNDVLVALVNIPLSLVRIFVCLMGYSVVRKEGRFFYEAMQVRNRLYDAIGINNGTDIQLELIPEEHIEIFSWRDTREKANNPFILLFLRAINPVKWKSLGIRDWFQVTLLLSILLFIVIFTAFIIVSSPIPLGFSDFNFGTCTKPAFIWRL